MVKRLLYNPHAGEILKKEFLNELGMSQDFLATAIGVSSNIVNDIVRGRCSVTEDTDLRLCKFFGLSEGYFFAFANCL